jgi:hypothetical protein
VALLFVGLLGACSHPLEPVGEGDILSASGNRDCLLEDYQAGKENCTKNLVIGEYRETYFAQARPGWRFERWENQCEDVEENQCSFNFSGKEVEGAWGHTLPALRAIFIEEPVEHLSCDTSFDADDVFIVDLSPDSEATGACGVLSDSEEIAACVEGKIRGEFAASPGCLGEFDVFVPGTNQEDGNYQQFTSIVSPNPGRTYLSLQYSYKPTLLDDTIDYDKGVRDATEALERLLYTLRTRFESPDVRVYGHSKGSDPVARVAQRSAHSEVQFFAFAQPGRTPSSILGAPGYIEKLAPNLIALTWQNDEVKYYSGGDSGKQFPEVWGFPGFVNQAGGGQTIFPMRIDHHNNYGGNYQKSDFPYCAAGNKAAMVATNECKHQSGVRYLPYFWGNSECQMIVHDMMNNGSVGDKHYIGNSGPRAGGCRDTVSTVSARYHLRYSINIADQDDCKYHMELAFRGSSSGTTRTHGSKIKWSSTRDTYNRVKTGTIQVPLHMTLNWKARMEDVSGAFSKCINYAGAKSEGYIHGLSVTFRHPGTGRTVTRTLIGNAEGLEYLWPLKLANKPNVAWRKKRGSWNLHFGLPPSYPADALMIKGSTKDKASGEFYKPVHLVD